MPVQVLVIFLTLGTGALDAIAILALGEAFASVMTGNLVLAGLAAGTWSSELLAHIGSAILGYIAGGAVGSFSVNKLRRQREHSIWPPRVTAVLSAQFLLILALALWWFVGDGDFSTSSAQVTVLFMAASAMGMQSAAIRAIGVTVSTTYMTGALTTLVESVVTRRPFSATEKAALVGLLALITGAAAGGYIANTWSSWALVFPLTTLGCVIILC
ncbi:YoaK family protein, partial [Arthrobacter pigmenti]